jgi:transcriptional regulator with XRE-family HTH domain
VVDGSTVAGVLSLVERYGAAFAAVLPTCRVWVNGEPAEPDVAVSETDGGPAPSGVGWVAFRCACRPPRGGGAPHRAGRLIRSQRGSPGSPCAGWRGRFNPYLSQIERGLRKPSADILQQIAKALQISAESLYVRAGILDPDQDVVVSVVDAVHRDPYLSPEQKQTLLRVYESLRAQAAAVGSAAEPAGA